MENPMFALSKDGNTVMTKSPKKAVRLIKEHGYTVTKRLFGETEYSNFRIEDPQTVCTVKAFLKKEYSADICADSLCIDIAVSPRESMATIGTETINLITTGDTRKVARLRELMRMLLVEQDGNYIVELCSSM